MKIFSFGTTHIRKNLNQNIKRAIAVSTLAALGAYGATHASNVLNRDSFENENIEQVGINDKNLVMDKNMIKSIQKSLPYINDGLFTDVVIKDNQMILDETYKLNSKDGKVFEGIDGFWEKQTFSVEKTQNGEYNVIYTKNGEKEAVAFDKYGRVMDLVSAVMSNKDDTIKKFSNPLPKDVMSSIEKSLGMTMFGRVEYKDNTISVISPNRIIRYKHHEGLKFEDESVDFLSDNKNISNVIDIEFEDDGGYYISVINNDNKQKYHFLSNHKYDHKK